MRVRTMCGIVGKGKVGMNKSSLRGKILAGACAASLALAMPVVSIAAPSPSNSTTTTGQNNVTVVTNGTKTDGSNTSTDYYVIRPTDKVVPGYDIDVPTAVDAVRIEQGGKIPIASFDITTDNDINQIGKIDFTFNVGPQYAGSTIYIYFMRPDGSTGYVQAVVGQDGLVSVTLDAVTLVTLVVDADTIPEGSGVKADKGDTAPQTGVGVVGVAAGTAGMSVAACAAGFALRKKVREQH